MSSRREVFIRILALLQRKTLIETKNRTLKWHYWTVRWIKNVALLTEDGAFALFFHPHPGRFASSRVPTPGNLPSKAKKMLIPGGQPGGAWAQVELTDALFRSNIKCLLQNIQNCWQRFSKFQTRVSLLHFLKETLPAILNISKKTTLKIRANILLNRL